MEEGIDNLKSGIVSLGKGQFKEAEQSFRDYLALKPDSPEGWLLLGDVLLLVGRTDEARKAHQRAGALDSRLAVKSTIESTLTVGNQKHAYSDVIDLTEHTARISLGDESLLLPPFAVEALSEELPELQSAVQAEPESRERWAKLGSTLWALGRYNEAAEAHGRSLALDPKDRAARESLMMCLGPLAKAYIEAEAARPPSKELQELLGKLHAIEAEMMPLANGPPSIASWERLGKLGPERYELLERITNLDPNNTDCWAGLANASLVMERFDKAEFAFSQYIRGDPDNAQAWFMLALSIGAQGRDAKARGILYSMLRRFPNDPNAGLFVQILNSQPLSAQQYRGLARRTVLILSGK
jgi:cytochrome c-type biogenesis protein CcmH/NrfG